MGTKDEINAMIKTLEGGRSVTDAPATDAPTTESPGTEAPGTASPATEAPNTKAPATDAPSTSAPTTEAPEDEKDKTIRDLREKLNEKEKSTTAAPTTEAPLVLGEQDFIGNLDVDDLVRDKDALNKLLNTVFTKGVTESRKLASEKVLLALPDIVKHNITLLSKLKEASDKFYEENKDLTPFKKVVATVFEEVASKNPGKNYEDLMKEVGIESRKRLELYKKAQGNDKGNNKGNPPKLPQKKGGNRVAPTKPNISPIQNEIDEMNKTIRR
jgi:hypothetical protein